MNVNYISDILKYTGDDSASCPLLSCAWTVINNPATRFEIFFVVCLFFPPLVCCPDVIVRKPNIVLIAELCSPWAAQQKSKHDYHLLGSVCNLYFCVEFSFLVPWKQTRHLPQSDVMSSVCFPTAEGGGSFQTNHHLLFVKNTEHFWSFHFWWYASLWRERGERGPGSNRMDL